MSERIDSALTFEEERYEDEVLHAVHTERLLEKESSPIGFSALPIVLIFFSAFLIFWSGIYLVNFTAGFNALLYDEHIEPGAPPPPPPRKSLFEVGEGVYANCTVCHQPNGLGIPGAFPPLAGSEWALGNPERVAVIVMNGLMGPIDVKGATFNSAMPGLGAALSDEQIAAVATFVRGNSEWGNSASEVPEEMVAGLRAQYGARLTMWTVAELEQVFAE